MPEAGGAEAKLLAYFRAWLANLVLASVDISVSLTFGGAALGVALSCDATRPGWWFVVGACLPLGPLGLWATSRRAFRAELAMIKTLRDDGLITEAEYDTQRGRILASRSDRPHPLAGPDDPPGRSLGQSPEEGQGQGAGGRSGRSGGPARIDRVADRPMIARADRR